MATETPPRIPAQVRTAADRTLSPQFPRRTSKATPTLVSRAPSATGTEAITGNQARLRNGTSTSCRPIRMNRTEVSAPSRSDQNASTDGRQSPAESRGRALLPRARPATAPAIGPDTSNACASR